MKIEKKHLAIFMVFGLFVILLLLYGTYLNTLSDEKPAISAQETIPTGTEVLPPTKEFVVDVVISPTPTLLAPTITPTEVVVLPTATNFVYPSETSLSDLFAASLLCKTPCLAEIVLGETKGTDVVSRLENMNGLELSYAKKNHDCPEKIGGGLCNIYGWGDLDPIGITTGVATFPTDDIYYYRISSGNIDIPEYAIDQILQAYGPPSYILIDATPTDSLMGDTVFGFGLVLVYLENHFFVGYSWSASIQGDYLVSCGAQHSRMAMFVTTLVGDELVTAEDFLDHKFIYLSIDWETALGLSIQDLTDKFIENRYACLEFPLSFWERWNE